ncbi:thioredoxin-domain-containing protein [Aaosphaeria arxii CBS 175.79]|uniref:Thioredoxin-domain-containing protein n=1 Tax=Aaosphaeria arxii CBS 175.79 TaxID=1450172 RepID=A0A6A5XAK3_9PLEO|nr:thioredoxin-domain-containing protein [Aaosphaeria arxii CBS 175.79]KAF2009971.1 thioredoxin-domain-containing protein [Aaosphaeria arxii CBS 175.79]
MFATSTIFRRTLLTTARSPKTAPTYSNSTATLFQYRPILSAAPRFFSYTSSKMTSEGGVHNLAAKAEWDSALEAKDTLIVLDCFATWCGPCKVIAPQVLKYSKAYPEARFYKLDVDEVPDVAQELGIRAMPTFLLFKNGDKVGEVVGANPKALEAAIKSGLEQAE